MPQGLFTIGHSTMEFGTFVAILKEHRIDLVCDVRSRPQSIRFLHFDQVELEGRLREAGLHYIFLGEELGGRPDDPRAYGSDGLVDYRARRRSYAFQVGIERVTKELDQHDLALLCAEEDPIACHRFLMICPELAALGIEPLHVRKQGRVETQREAEDRLLQAQQLDAIAGASLFSADREAALESAYLEQAKKCAFRIDPAVLPSW